MPRMRTLPLRSSTKFATYKQRPSNAKDRPFGGCTMPGLVASCSIVERLTHAGVLCVGEKGGNAHDALVPRPPQNRRRTHQRSDTRRSHEGPRSPTRTRRELHKVLV